MGKTEDVIMDYLSRPEILSDLFNGYFILEKKSGMEHWN